VQYWLITRGIALVDTDVARTVTHLISRGFAERDLLAVGEALAGPDSGRVGGNPIGRHRGGRAAGGEET
jgi:hypothetical protein